MVGFKIFFVKPVDHVALLVENVCRVRCIHFSHCNLIGAVPGHCPDRVRSRDRHPESEDTCAFFHLLLCSVHKKCDPLLVRVHFDLRHILRTVCVSAAAEMHKWVFAPVCLVYIERILFDPAVHRHKPFLVLAVLATLVAPVRSEIKQIPHVRCPQIRALLNHFCHMLVVNTLIFLRVIAPLRIRTVICRIRIRAVLGESDHPVGVSAVIFVKKAVVLFQFPDVPAKIEIVAVHIRYL